MKAVNVLRKEMVIQLMSASTSMHNLKCTKEVFKRKAGWCSIQHWETSKLKKFRNHLFSASTVRFPFLSHVTFNFQDNTILSRGSRINAKLKASELLMS
mmetsp:Transcript_47838/g.144701  ORF Transcript_47838/g.144701 Transcript_47838/m.144701 type:complete len:99 (+) Transcript_47838:829-1125(+)